MRIPARFRAVRAAHPSCLALAAVTVALLVAWPVVDFFLREQGVVTKFWFADFTVYLDGVAKWRTGQQLYVANEDGGYHLEYLYPPVTLVLFWPFTGFEFPVNAMLFGGLSLVLLWVGLDAVAASLGYDLRHWERLVVLFALFGFQPALRDFKWGQVSTFLAALLCFAFCAQERGATDGPGGRFSRVASGALTTLGSAFKLFVAASGAHLLRDRERLAGALATAVVLVAASLALFGLDAHRAYLDVLRWGKGWGESRPSRYWDTSAAYRPLHVFGGLAMPLRGLGLIAVVALTLATRNRTAATVRRATFALGVAVVPLLAPRADTHDLVLVLLPALVALAVEFEHERGVPALPVLVVLLFHLHRYVVEVAVNPPTWLPHAAAVTDHAAWVQPGMWASFLLVGLLASRVAEYASLPGE